MGSKLPKRILKMKGLTMKQKWAMHKRGSTKGKTGSRRSSKSAPAKKSKWGVGRYIGMARIADVLTRPLQSGHYHKGLHKDALKVGAELYGAGYYGKTDSAKAWGKKYAKSTYGGLGTGVIVTTLKSKLGVYKGAGKLKLLSVAQSLTPEILAASEHSPLDNFNEFNTVRTQYDSAYDLRTQKWNLDPNTPMGKRFWADKSMNIALGVIQKVAFNTNGWLKLNKYFPKDFNF